MPASKPSKTTRGSKKSRATGRAGEAAPRVSRPNMPAYGIASGKRGMKPWLWAERAFASSRNYWVTTVHPDGRPNSTAVWGVWLEGVFWFSCAPNSRKAKNLYREPRCTVTTERADEAVIIEGEAAPLRGRAENLPFVRAYKQKYEWEMDPGGDGHFVVTPRVGFAFVEHADQFAEAATRYEFGV